MSSSIKYLLNLAIVLLVIGLPTAYADESANVEDKKRNWACSLFIKGFVKMSKIWRSFKDDFDAQPTKTAKLKRLVTKHYDPATEPALQYNFKPDDGWVKLTGKAIWGFKRKTTHIIKRALQEKVLRMKPDKQFTYWTLPFFLVGGIAGYMGTMHLYRTKIRDPRDLDNLINEDYRFEFLKNDIDEEVELYRQELTQAPGGENPGLLASKVRKHRKKLMESARPLARMLMEEYNEFAQYMFVPDPETGKTLHQTLKFEDQLAQITSYKFMYGLKAMTEDCGPDCGINRVYPTFKIAKGKTGLVSNKETQKQLMQAHLDYQQRQLMIEGLFQDFAVWESVKHVFGKGRILSDEDSLEYSKELFADKFSYAKILLDLFEKKRLNKKQIRYYLKKYFDLIKSEEVIAILEKNGEGHLPNKQQLITQAKVDLIQEALALSAKPQAQAKSVTAPNKNLTPARSH